MRRLRSFDRQPPSSGPQRLCDVPYGPPEPVPPESPFRMVRICSGHEQGCRKAMLAENRPSRFLEIDVGVVEGNQNGARRKPAPVLKRLQNLCHGHHVIVFRQIGYLLAKLSGGVMSRGSASRFGPWPPR